MGFYLKRNGISMHLELLPKFCKSMTFSLTYEKKRD